MNKQRIYDILSSIQMSPRDKKDLVNAIFNGAGKEVYILDLDNFKTAEDFNNLKNAIDSNKIICVGNDVANGFHFGNANGVEYIAFFTGVTGYSIEDPAELSISWRKISVYENGRIDVKNYYNPDGGDGTKFLSDDGTYKPISTSNNEPYIFEYSDDLKNIGLDGLFELNEAITSGKKIIIRYKFNDITPMITVPEDGVFNGGVNFYFVSYVPGEGEYLFSVDVASWDYSVSVAKHALNFQ